MVDDAWNRNLYALDSAVRSVCPIVGLSVENWSDRSTWHVDYSAAATPVELSLAAAAIASFQYVDVLPPTIQLGVLQNRIQAENAWDTYVNYMFATNLRRNAFLLAWILGNPIRADDAGFRNTLLGSGLTQDQVNRITAV